MKLHWLNTSQNKIIYICPCKSKPINFTELCSVVSSYTNDTQETAHLHLHTRSKVMISACVIYHQTLSLLYYGDKSFCRITVLLHLFKITGGALGERDRQEDNQAQLNRLLTFSYVSVISFLSRRKNNLFYLSMCCLLQAKLSASSDQLFSVKQVITKRSPFSLYIDQKLLKKEL